MLKSIRLARNTLSSKTHPILYLLHLDLGDFSSEYIWCTKEIEWVRAKKEKRSKKRKAFAARLDPIKAFQQDLWDSSYERQQEISKNFRTRRKRI